MKKLIAVNSIGKVITLIFVVTSVLLFTIITILRTIKTTEDLKQRKLQLLESKQNELKSYIDIAYKIIENSYEKSKSEDEIKFRAGDKLEQITAVLLNTMETYYNQNKNEPYIIFSSFPHPADQTCIIKFIIFYKRNGSFC